jgi:gamma-glutamyltranspeptidase/glutathione hydrolase
MRRLSLLVAVGLLIALSGVRPGAQTSTWRPVVLSDTGMVASGHALASEAGIRILKAGGNAVDAAIAAGPSGPPEPDDGSRQRLFMLISRTGGGSSTARAWRPWPPPWASTSRKAAFRATASCR